MRSGRISFLHMPKPCIQAVHCMHRTIQWVLGPCHTFPSIWHAWLLLVRLDCLKHQRPGRLAFTFCILMAPMAGHTDQSGCTGIKADLEERSRSRQKCRF